MEVDVNLEAVYRGVNMKKSGMNLKALCIVLLLIACTLPAAAASLVQLTNDSALDLYPFWSPDGE